MCPTHQRPNSPGARHSGPWDNAERGRGRGGTTEASGRGCCPAPAGPLAGPPPRPAPRPPGSGAAVGPGPSVPTSPLPFAVSGAALPEPQGVWPGSGPRGPGLQDNLPAGWRPRPAPRHSPRGPGAARTAPALPGQVTAVTLSTPTCVHSGPDGSGAHVVCPTGQVCHTAPRPACPAHSAPLEREAGRQERRSERGGTRGGRGWSSVRKGPRAKECGHVRKGERPQGRSRPAGTLILPRGDPFGLLEPSDNKRVEPGHPAAPFRQPGPLLSRPAGWPPRPVPQIRAGPSALQPE